MAKIEDLEIVARPLLENDSLIAVFTGPRGGGKTLTLVAEAAGYLLLGKRVWSNFKISFPDRRGKHFEALPLEINQLFQPDSELRDGYMIVDEIQLLMDSRRSMTTMNRLLNSGFAQIRKRRLSLLCSSKNFQWLDVRLRYETDITCDCRDASKEPGAKEKNVKKGEVFFLSWRDMSGLMTGRSYFENGVVYPQVLAGRMFWDCYNTFEEIAPAELIVHQEEDITQDQLAKYVNGLRATGITELSHKEFWSGVEGAGIQGSKVTLGKMLEGCGVSRPQWYRYILAEGMAK